MNAERHFRQDTDAVRAGPAPQTAARDRVVRVFVSSTFRDMVEDRNELMAHAWPALRRICRERGVEFVEVDLRWGVTEAQAQRKETLRHCLAEIKRCRPYFIGLLGERYGWTPPSEAYSPALLEEESWLKVELATRSVTELEIFHGVLNDPEMATRAFFYIRDPKYPETRSVDRKAEAPEQRERQDALKTRVKEVCASKCIPLRENYADPQALAGLVLADVTAAIDAEFPPGQPPDAWTREDRDHWAYAGSRRNEFYVSRDTYFDRLDRYAREGADAWGLTVLGASGGGKSALLANWAARWRNANRGDLVFEHYIGSSPMSASHLALMRRLMVAVIRWSRDETSRDEAQASFDREEDRIPAQAEEIVKTFPGYLDRLAVRAKEKGCRAILIFDALNQLEDRERGRLLAWLPRRLPGDVRLIVSTLPGDTLEALKPFGWPDPLTVEPLTPEERVKLIARYLEHFSQASLVTRAEKIAAAEAASNPLYIKSLLDDLRATGDHERLDAQIDDYLQAADIPALLEKILARYERDYERDRPALVREALSLLWAARRGLTERELLELLKPTGGPSLPAALWSPVRYALEDGLVDRDGVLAFAHEHLRTAVERRYARDPETARGLRVRLADYFASQPVNERQADELPWLLRQVEDRDRLRDCLLDMDRFLQLVGRDSEELRRYWIWLKEERAMGRLYADSFDVWVARPMHDDATRSDAAKQMGFFLNSAGLHGEAESICRWGLRFDERVYGRDHPKVAAKLNDLALLLEVTHRTDDALALYRRALSIDERNYGPDHPSVARDLNNLALRLKNAKDPSGGEAAFRRALDIGRKCYGPNSPDTATFLCNLGWLLSETGRVAEGEAMIREALAIEERHYGERHPNVAMTLSSLGVLLRATLRWEEAERCLRQALAIDEECLGEDHHFVALASFNLARLLHQTMRLEEAQILMRRAVEGFVAFARTTGDPHPNLHVFLNSYARLLQDMGWSRDEIRARLRRVAPEFPEPA